MKESAVAGQENSFDNFSDRLSQTLQLLIARKIWKYQFTGKPDSGSIPIMLLPGDDKTIFALGGAFRLPVKGKFSLLLGLFSFIPEPGKY